MVLCQSGEIQGCAMVASPAAVCFVGNSLVEVSVAPWWRGWRLLTTLYAVGQ